MSAHQVVDYAQSGLTIVAAMKDHFGRFPNKLTRPPYIPRGRYLSDFDWHNL